MSWDTPEGASPHRRISPTTRTAFMASGTQKIYEAWNLDGVFAGTSYELLESELTDAERLNLERDERAARGTHHLVTDL